MPMTQGARSSNFCNHTIRLTNLSLLSAGGTAVPIASKVYIEPNRKLQDYQ